MKLTRLLILTILFVSMLFHANVSAQDYTQCNLPEGTKARLGKGTITGDIQYSPDGSLLAVPSTVGIWVYDAETHQEINLLVGHTDLISAVAFSPEIKADVNADGIVNIQDLVLVASHFGETGLSPGDVNGDGVVNIQDLVLIASHLGDS